jgi:hypothetical protein
MNLITIAHQVQALAGGEARKLALIYQDQEYISGGIRGPGDLQNYKDWLRIFLGLSKSATSPC